ncbi:hypothetical protein [Emticicia sp. 17c]|uniref:hypothetical protein n=1 Tax=Emticicia sp. 17c TaxID=3127704 RepID=UPI00301C00FD
MRLLLLACLCSALLPACSSKTNEQKTDSSAIAEKTVTPANDWLCIAGERAGVVLATSSEKELIEQLGSANVSPHDTIYGPEGMFTIGTILYKGTPNEAHIWWKDTLNFAKPEGVEIGWVEAGNENKIEWHTNTGIKVGTTLVELEKINEKPFQFSGFGWDYGGAVVDWNGGKLMDKDGSSYLAVTLAYNYEDERLNSVADKVLGDKTFSSKDPNAQKLNPFVSKIMVSFR